MGVCWVHGCESSGNLPFGICRGPDTACLSFIVTEITRGHLLRCGEETVVKSPVPSLVIENRRSYANAEWLFTVKEDIRTMKPSDPVEYATSSLVR